MPVEEWAESQQIDMGGRQWVVLHKLYGPHIFMKIRIMADPARGWVIERESGPDGVWVEWVVIPDQMDIDFIDWDKVTVTDREKQ